MDLNEIFTIFLAASLMSIFVEYPFINLKKLVFDDKPVPQQQTKHRSPSASKKLVAPDVILSRTAKK